MKREIVIGGDLDPKFNSTALWSWADISQNSIFYIIENKLFEVRIYIIKDSDSGEQLREWINDDDNRNNESIQVKSLQYILSYITFDDIKNVIDKEKKRSYTDGYEAAQRNIRKCLGIY